jgi:pyrrolidone-carboxylate peptidase
VGLRPPISTFPSRDARRALAEGVPAVSNTAGTFLCNQTLYATSTKNAMRERTIPASTSHSFRHGRHELASTKRAWIP